MRGWSSKAGRSGIETAHYLDVDERPLCARLQYRDGPALATFTCTWTAMRETDKRCRHCVRLLREPR